MHSWMDDIVVVSGLAMKVHTAYNDNPDYYRHISEEIAALQILVDKVAQHFKRSAISRNDRHEGQRVLEGCKGVLEDLFSLMEKYKRRASTNKRLPFMGVKLGEDNIMTLRERLILNTGLLHGFDRSCEYIDIQVQLAIVLRLRYTRIPLTSIITFATNTNMRLAYENFCQDLKQLGVTERMIRLEENEILDILKPKGVGANQIGGSSIGGQGHYSSTAKVKASLPMGCKADSLMREAISGGNSALLHLIACNSQTGTVALLFGKGALIDYDKNTLLHCAAGGGFTDTVKQLLEKEAPVGAINRVGEAPLHLAAKGGHTDTAVLLLAKGASIEGVQFKSFTPLHWAAYYGHTSTVELLLGKGASIEAENIDKCTPLHVAAYNGHNSIVELILSKGVSIEAMGPTNRTSLHLATWMGHTSTVELLLSKGASIEARNKYGDTPLHDAARRGRTNTLELLLLKGASIEAINEAGQTPLALARRGNHTDTMKLLQNQAANLGNIRTVSGYIEAEVVDVCKS